MQQELISVSSGISSHTSQSCIKFLENVQGMRGWEWKYKCESDLWSPSIHAGGHHWDGRHWSWERLATPAPTRTSHSESICWTHLTVIFIGYFQEPKNLSGAWVMPPSHLTLEWVRVEGERGAHLESTLASVFQLLPTPGNLCWGSHSLHYWVDFYILFMPCTLAILFGVSKAKRSSLFYAFC